MRGHQPGPQVNETEHWIARAKAGDPTLAADLFNVSAGLRMRYINLGPLRYVERYLVEATEERYTYLHRFVADDGDRGLHDHAWYHAMSVVLAGGYREKRFELNRGPVREIQFVDLKPGDTNHLGEHIAHQIISVKPETWTLFTHTPWIPNSDWGFYELDDEGNWTFHPSATGGSNRGWLTSGPRGSEVDRLPFPCTNYERTVGVIRRRDTEEAN